MSNQVKLCKDCKHAKYFGDGGTIRCANPEVNRTRADYLARPNDDDYSDFANCNLVREYRFFNRICGHAGSLWESKDEVSE